LGIKISTQKIVKILNNLGLKTDKNLMVEIPTIRRDISFEEDLIEEVGRIYGYQRIKPSFPTISLIPPKENEEFIFKNKIKEILKSIGFVEVYNYSFIGEREKEIFGFKDDIVELMNPISSFYKYLRPSLIPNLLKNVSFNLKYFNDIKIFELGKVFKRDWQKKLIEDNALTILISRREPKEEIFFELKGVSDFLLKGLGISNFFYDEFKPVPEKILSSLLHHKKTAEIKVGDKKIGFLGEISPLILKELRINHKVVILDFNFKELIELSTEEREYLPPSIYPSVIRDLSLLVPLEVKVDEVLNIINLVSEDLVKDVELFDIYEDEAFGGRKSLSFRIVYQAEDRTLRSEEVEKVHQKIIKALEKNPNWEVRK
jgi:phenylalanyl-tRNA synthetase beta chain